MKINNLSASVLLALAGTAAVTNSAQAVNLNPDGLGQVLIYPYYTTRAGNKTIMSVVNTSKEAKAVKVRFLEGQNSKEVLDFNLYLSRYDVWTAVIVDGEDFDENCDMDNGISDNQCGVPHLMTTDTSCTVPYLYQMASTGPGLQSFLRAALTDGGSTSFSRTAEGHFEMIEMGTLINEERGSATAATHSNGVPTNCQQLVEAWTQGPDGIPGSSDDGYWLDSSYGALTDIEDPSGGLMGGASIINVEEGTMFSYKAKAINGFANSAEQQIGSLHTFPGNEAPNLGSGDRNDGHVFGASGSERSAIFDATLDAVSYVFMHDSMMNEYNAEDALFGHSEWVVTFPTKQSYVNPSIGPIAPFTSVWSDNNEDGVKDGACERVLLDSLWDREEGVAGDTPGDSCPPIVSPGEVTCGDPIIPFELCFEANVIRFGPAGEGGSLIPAETEIFGSVNFTNVATDGAGFQAGWARVDLYAYPVSLNLFDLREPLGSDAGFDGDAQYGLPVTGFWALAVENGFNGDPEVGLMLTNYGGLFDHSATRCFAGSDCREDLDLVPKVQ